MDDRLLRRCAPLALVCAVALSALAGCAATPPAPPPRLDADAAVDQATTLASSGQTPQAFALLDRAANDNPVNARPWLKKAQLQFDQGDYPAAIVSAQEAVKRDGTSQEARSIAVVASLRIAIKSLTELRGEQNLNSNAQAEAQRLATVLRESLSTELLVPTEAPPEPVKKPVRRAPVRKPGSAPKAETATTAPEKPAESSDPFGALRN